MTDTIVEDFDHSRILHCPFCGDTGELHRVKGGGTVDYYVKCAQEGCAVFILTHLRNSPDEAVRVWNHRA